MWLVLLLAVLGVWSPVAAQFSRPAIIAQASCAAWTRMDAYCRQTGDTPDTLWWYNGTAVAQVDLASAISDTAYGAGWNGVTTTAPSQNAVYDKIEAYASDTLTFTNKRITPRTVTLTDTTPITINSDNANEHILTSLSQATTFNAPSGTPTSQQPLNLTITSTTSRALTWNAAFVGTTANPLPTATTGGSVTDYLSFLWNAATSKWDFVGATANNALVHKERRVCMIVVGADNGSALVDADLGPQLHQCFIPYAATVVEITVFADAGTPNVIVHRRTGTTNTALLSSALATAASGAIACSKTAAVTGLDGATTCSATLQNTAVTQGHTIGLTSGTAGGVAKRMSIAITMTVD